MDRRTKELAAINSLTRTVTASLMQDEVLSAAYDHILSIVKPDLVVIYLRDGNDLICQGDKPENQTWRNEAPPIKKVGQCLCGLVTAEGRPISVLDIACDPRCTLNECKKAGIRSFAALPLSDENDVLGVVGLGSFSRRDFSQESTFLEIIASQISTGLKNAILHEKLQQEKIELENALSAQNKALSERNEMDLLLNEHISMLENILDKAADGICVSHNISEKPYIHFTHWNPRMTQITGYTRDEINQGGWYQSVFPDANIQRRALDRMLRLRKGDNILSEEWIITTKTGKKKSLSVSTSILKEEDKKIYVLAVMQDISYRKKAEEALRKSEEKYRLHFTHAHDVIYSISTDYEVLSVSPSVENLLGYRPDQLIGRPILELNILAPEYLEKAYLDMVRIFSGESVSSTFYEFIDKNGIKKFGEVSGAPLFRDSKIIGVISVARDITDRKKSEQALLESEKKFSLAFQTSPYAITITRAEDGKFVEVNDAFVLITGFERQEALESSSLELNLWVNKEDRNSIMNDLLNGRKVDGLEFLFRKKNGEIITGLFSAAVIPIQNEKFILACIDDITDRKEAEQALLRSQKQYRELVESANDAIIIVQDGWIVFHNQRAESLTGYSREQLVEIPFIDFIIPEDQKTLLERYQQKLEGEKFGHAYAFRIMDRNNREISVEVNTVVVSWKDKPALQCFIRDVTRQKKLEAQLHQAHKLEAIGTLAGGIAHDFNNIIGIILGNTELAMFDVREGSHARKNLETSREACFRARDLVRQILSFSRHTEQEKNPVILGVVIKESLKLLRSSIPSTIEIRQHIGDISDGILADPAQIHQVIINLCANAAHAMKEKGGVIEVNLTEARLDKTSLQQYPGLSPGAYLRLTVSDTGHGIDPKIINRIFDPYFTTKKIGEGSGMGLAVVHGIVQNHGGAITVYSEPGKGTIFKILFPKIETKAVHRKEILENPPTGKEKILYIDDEITLAEIGKQMLEHLGYKVEYKTNPLEVLERFKADPHEFDLVITDMTMPQMTGKILAQEMIRIRPDIPIILNSGYSDQMDEENARKLGIKAYILKPLNMLQLGKTIRNILDKK